MMKKVSQPPALQPQTGNRNRDRSAEKRAISQRALSCDFKKSILPHSVDLLLTLKYRR